MDQMTQERDIFDNTILDGSSELIGLIGSARPCVDDEIESLWSCFKGNFDIMTAYYNLEDFFRQATLYLAEEQGLGMGGAILVMSIIIKTSFTPPQLIAVSQLVEIN